MIRASHGHVNNEHRQALVMLAKLKTALQNYIGVQAAADCLRCWSDLTQSTCRSQRHQQIIYEVKDNTDVHVLNRSRYPHTEATSNLLVYWFSCRTPCCCTVLLWLYMT